jgi:hypothetical protein
MSDTWTPDEPQRTDTFEQGDEAIGEDERLDPDFEERLQLDPSIDPTLQVDDRELEEAGAEFDDPEGLVTLDGGIDDPDGIGGPTNREISRRDDDAGWDLDAPVTRGDRDPDDVVGDDFGSDDTAADSQE